MRTKILFLILFAPIVTSGQLIDELPKDENGNLNFNEVIQIDNTKKDELYIRSKQFFVDTFKSANDVIQMDDKEAGVVIGKGYNDIYIKIMGVNNAVQMWYTIKIQSKEGRYKYEIYDIYFKIYPSQYGGSTEATTIRAEETFDRKKYYKKNGDPKDIPEKYKIETVNKVNSLVKDIKVTMMKVSSTNKSDW